MNEFIQKRWINYGGGSPGLCIVCYLVRMILASSIGAVL